MAGDRGAQPPRRRTSSRPFDPNDTWLRGSVRALAERRRVTFAPGPALSDPGGVDDFAELVARSTHPGANECPACGPWIGQVTVRLNRDGFRAFAALKDAEALSAFLAERGLPEAPPCWLGGQHPEPGTRG